MTVRAFKSVEDIFADIGVRVEQGRLDAANHHIRVDELQHGSYFMYEHPVYEMPFFGEVIETTEFPEDDVSIATARTNGFIFGRCYSWACIEGELGDTHVTRIERKLTREQFEAAKALNWEKAPA
jgi:hypothetical protein